ncbi:MAG: ABC transporter permease [Victivallaceae bacterium]|nr:ABC transporter permease [Victivallaceae bacterium]
MPSQQEKFAIFDPKKIFFQVLDFTGESMRGFCSTLRHPGKLRSRDFFYYFDLCGPKSLPIVLLIELLTGMILGLQAAIQLRKFGTELYVADTLGWSVFKEMGPLMVGIVATGRAGSAFAAELGTMKVNEELSALTTMGISYGRFLVAPKLLAMMLAMPLLTVFGDLAAVAGGGMIAMTFVDLPISVYNARLFEVLNPITFLLGIVKALVFGILITLAGCYMGIEADSDAQGVGRAATSAVVISILLIVLSDALMTQIFSYIGY